MTDRDTYYNMSKWEWFVEGIRDVFSIALHSLQFDNSWSGSSTKKGREEVLKKLQMIMNEMEVELTVENND